MNYLVSDPENYVTVYWIDSLPEIVVLRPEKPADIVNVSGTKLKLVAYNDTFARMIYPEGPNLHYGVKPGVRFMDIFLKEEYASIKEGKGPE